VRVPSPRLVRVGSIVGGSQAEPGDSEATIPGVLQPIIELASPIDKVLVAAATQRNDSFFSTLELNVAGVAVAGGTDIAHFSKGLWILELAYSGMFTGTTNGPLRDGVSLNDPDGVVAFFIRLPRVTGSQLAWTQRYGFSFQRDDFTITLRNDATVGGDVLVQTASINARRML